MLLGPPNRRLLYMRLLLPLHYGLLLGIGIDLWKSELSATNHATFPKVKAAFQNEFSSSSPFLAFFSFRFFWNKTEIETERRKFLIKWKKRKMKMNIFCSRNEKMRKGNEILSSMSASSNSTTTFANFAFLLRAKFQTLANLTLMYVVTAYSS